MSYGGHLGETAAIAEIAADRGLILLEDAAHAAGSRSAGRHAGTFGLAGSFSFSASKNLGIGEGGMLVTDDPDVASRIARQSWHGLGSQPWLRHHQSAPEYELGSIGFNYRFDDPRAALVHSLLDRLDEENLRRKAIDEAYREAFSEQELLEPTLGPPPGDEIQLLPLHRGCSTRRSPAMSSAQLLADRGIQTTVHYPLLHEDGVHAQANARLPISEDYASRCVTLPLFPQMEDWQRELVIEVGRRCARTRCRGPLPPRSLEDTYEAYARSRRKQRSGPPTTRATSRSAPSCWRRSSSSAASALAGEGAILDVGCGGGWLLEELAAAGVAPSGCTAST